MTYSIVALDHATGELGVAVQTRWFAVGAICPWVEAGVGAVATQSFAEPAYGPRLLARLRDGSPPADALAALLAEDDGREVRQIGVVDTGGRTAAHTGARCVEAALHVTGDGVSCQANMMTRASVPAAMLDAYRAASGDLAAHLLAALRAAEAAGGDIRGRQSAALLVAPGGEGIELWRRRFDLRVDDASAPLDELERLLRNARADEELEIASNATDAGNHEAAAAAYGRAAELVPGNDQIAFSLALSLLAAGRPDDARRPLRQAMTANPAWPEFSRRMAAAGHLPPAAIAGLIDALARLEID